MENVGKDVMAELVHVGKGLLCILSQFFGGIADNILNGAWQLEGEDLPFPLNELAPKSPNPTPYNYLMDKGDPHWWYAISVGIQIGIYCMWIEAHIMVTSVLGNKHKKLTCPIDVELWL